MVVRLEETLTAERERIRPYVDHLERLVRRYDPQAHFRLLVGHVPGYWELDARVRPDLVENEDLQEAIGSEQTDILVNHDAAIAVVLLPRQD